MRLTADVIIHARASINPCDERELDLRGYKIPMVENLGVTQDQFDAMDFSDNEIKKLENFPRYKRLSSLLFCNNHISKISEELGTSLPNLSCLILTNNKLSTLAELKGLGTCTNLKMLSLLHNEVVNKQYYRLYVINLVPSLKQLDFQKVTVKERESAARLAKSQAGQTMMQDVAKQAEKAKTFTPGAPAAEEQKLTDEHRAIYADRIAKATTVEEIEMLSKKIQAGIIPSANYKQGGGGAGGDSGGVPVANGAAAAATTVEAAASSAIPAAAAAVATVETVASSATPAAAVAVAPVESAVSSAIPAAAAAVTPVETAASSPTPAAVAAATKSTAGGDADASAPSVEMETETTPPAAVPAASAAATASSRDVEDEAVARVGMGEAAVVGGGGGAGVGEDDVGNGDAPQQRAPSAVGEGSETVEEPISAAEGDGGDDTHMVVDEGEEEMVVDDPGDDAHMVVEEGAEEMVVDEEDEEGREEKEGEAEAPAGEAAAAAAAAAGTTEEGARDMEQEQEAEGGDPKLSEADIKSYKVAELKKALVERGLPTGGLKADLAARLMESEGY
ncbi:unnamed protein product [Pylaiella littoralis]